MATSAQLAMSLFSRSRSGHHFISHCSKKCPQYLIPYKFQSQSSTTSPQRTQKRHVWSFQHSDDSNVTPVDQKSSPIRKEYIFYLVAGLSLISSYYYWKYKTKQNSLKLRREMEKNFPEIYQAALATGMQVLAHPDHLDELKVVMLGNHTDERIGLRACVIPPPDSDEITDMAQVTDDVMAAAVKNSCILTMDVDYYLFPAVAKIEQDMERSNSSQIMVKEAGRKRLFMNRIVNVNCYVPLSAVPESEMHDQESKTKIMALHVKMTQMSENMTPFIEDFRVTEVNLVDVSTLPWRNQWKNGSFIQWVWYNRHQSVVNIEKSVTPGGMYQFVSGIPVFQRHFSYTLQSDRQ